jgi:3-hydroxyisobutyrate dehydrogenase
MPDTTNSSNMPRIGFIGLGHMGSRMARRLLDAGYSLGVYDRTQEHMEPLARAGARRATSPSELAAGSDIVISMLSNDEAVREVMFGDQDVLTGAKPGSILVDMSTVSPETSRAVRDAAGRCSVYVLDATVSGSTPLAEQGSLVIFVGGDNAAFQRCKPIFDVLGKSVYYMGPSGAGTTMKLVVNTLLGLEMQAIAEAIAFGEKAGLPKGELLDVLAQTAVIAPAHAPKLDNARREEYPANFALPLMHKDFGLILQHAAELDVPMPATAAAYQMANAELALRQREGDGQAAEEDFSAVIKLMEGLAGLDPRPIQ